MLAARVPASSSPLAASTHPLPVVALSASASMSVPNDRLQAWLRAEAESTSATTAAAQVNARIAKALAEAKQYPAVKTASAGYSTQQITEVGKAARWRVTQTVSLESNDFTAAATLISKLQDEGGLLHPRATPGEPYASVRDGNIRVSTMRFKRPKGARMSSSFEIVKAGLAGLHNRSI